MHPTLQYCRFKFSECSLSGVVILTPTVDTLRWHYVSVIITSQALGLATIAVERSCDLWVPLQ